MKPERSWAGWRHLERAALLTVCAVCAYVAAQPLRDRLFAWQSQRALRAQWQQAQAQTSQGTDKNVRLSSASAHRKLPSSHDANSTQSSGSDEASILWPVTRLTCPRIDLDAVVVEGTNEEQLKLGPGHDVNTSYAGGPNCVIAAHRNAYGSWFYRLSDLKRGDSLVLQVPGCKYTYRVAKSRTVSVRDTSILCPPPDAAPRLTLYTCTLPKTESRLVVVANLKKIESA